jgi:phosphate transport system protein
LHGRKAAGIFSGLAAKHSLQQFTSPSSGCNEVHETFLLRAQKDFCSKGTAMGSAAGITETVLYDTLVNYLISMARVVEGAMNRALEAIVSVDDPKASALTGEVFLLEPRINEMEIVIDEHAIRLLRRGGFSDDEMRLIVAALKITNDLERIGDLAVNLAERVTTLREMPGSKAPDELEAMTIAVRTMVTKSLGALIFRNATMASQVLESDDLVDQYRDRIFEQLMDQMTRQTALVGPSMQFILATRHLERIADHATNIAEDIIYWVRGLDVRHGRGLGTPPATLSGPEDVTEDSHGLYSDVTAGPDTRHV